MTAMRVLLVTALLGCACAAHAQGDPLKSPECAQAIAQLQAAPGAVARQHAAQVCLGGSVPATPRSNRWAQEPTRVAPPTIEVAPAPVAAVKPPPTIPPPVRIDRAATIASCDLTGCWTSEGARLPRIGPSLASPSGGVCTVQGATAFCP